MENKFKYPYYIKANPDRGEGIIKKLIELGGDNENLLKGDSVNGIYYIDYDGNIKLTSFGNEEYPFVITYFTEVKLLKEEFKRGDLVLVKNTSTGDWKEAIFSFKGGNGNYYMQGGTMWKYCIPFDIDKLGKSTD